MSLTATADHDFDDIYNTLRPLRNTTMCLYFQVTSTQLKDIDCGTVTGLVYEKGNISSQRESMFQLGGQVSSTFSC